MLVWRGPGGKHANWVGGGLCGVPNKSPTVRTMTKKRVRKTTQVIITARKCKVYGLDIAGFQNLRVGTLQKPDSCMVISI